MTKKETVEVQGIDEATLPPLDLLLAGGSLRCCKSISVTIDRDAGDAWTPEMQLCSHLPAGTSVGSCTSGSCASNQVSRSWGNLIVRSFPCVPEGFLSPRPVRFLFFPFSFFLCSVIFLQSNPFIRQSFFLFAPKFRESSAQPCLLIPHPSHNLFFLFSVALVWPAHIHTQCRRVTTLLF